MMIALPWWPGMFLVNMSWPSILNSAAVIGYLCFFRLPSVMAMLEGATSALLTLVVNSDNLFVSVSAFVYQHKNFFFPSSHGRLFAASLICVIYMTQ